MAFPSIVCRIDKGLAMTTLTIDIDERSAAELRRLAERSGSTEGEMAAELLRRSLILEALDALRGRLEPYAAKAGYAADQDILGALS